MKTIIKTFIALNIFLFVFTVKSYGWTSPTLASPSTGSSTWTGLTLDWNAVSASQQYQLQVDTSASFNSPVLLSIAKTYINSNSSNSDTENYIENLYFGKTYFWRVRAYITGDSSAWSTVRTFNTVDYVTLSSPATGSSNWTGLTLDWAAHPGVDFYDLEVDSSGTFNSSVFITVPKTYINSSGSNSDTEHYLENLFFGKTYYWRVRARNMVDTSAWSTVRTFNTFDYVTLTSPANQQVNVNIAGVTLNWNAHPGISIYQLEIDTIPLFNSPFLIQVNNNYINSSGSNNDTQYGTGALLSNHIYYWRVRATNTVDTCVWTAWVFSTGSCSPPIQPIVITGNTTVCSGNSSTYSIAAVGGATNYSWLMPSGWTGFSLSNSIAITPGSTSGTISVMANNTCGSSPVQTLNVTVSGGVPTTPIIISGNSPVCSGSSNTYTIAEVNGATSYTWTLPSGYTGSSTTNSITSVASSTTGTITVKANNFCGSSSAQSMVVIISGSIPATPGTISGTATICSGSSNTYSIATVSGATDYLWTLPNGWTGSSTTNTITIVANSVSGPISVKSNNNCGSSAAQTKIITVSVSTPATPGTISGTATVCSGSSNTYSITPVSDATTYTWTLPTGYTGSSTTNSIITTSGSTDGNITVTANNACGSSAAQTFSVTIGGSIPATPGTISGTAIVCPVSSNTYSITAVSGATSYVWTLPNGWTGTSTTNSITTAATSSGGSITVIANNTCGSSTAQVKSVAVNTINISVSQVGATLTAAATGASYQWINCNGNTTIAGQTNQTYTPLGNGDYAVIITQNGCLDTSACYTIFITAVETGESLLTEIETFPNPSVGKFIFTTKNFPTGGQGVIEIYNALGEKTYTSSYNQQTTEEINLSNSPKGIYLVKLFLRRAEGNGSEIYNKKIIVQ